jgi:uncharacterized SAM-binding protein YcdF (DUF218 family)
MDSLFFFTSKCVWALINPVNLIILLTCLATILLVFNIHKLAKRIFILLLFINVPLLVYPVGDLLIYPLESRFERPEVMPSNIDGIIVLGGAESLKKSVSWQQAQVNEAAERYLYTAKLAKRYPKVPVLYTGGSGSVQFRDDAKSAEIAGSLLTASGIDSQQLIIESASRNTAQNFELIKSLLPRKSGHYLLVTSAFHMPRSVAIARRHHIDVIPYPVDYRSDQPSLRNWELDYINHVQTLNTAWREWIGLTAYYFDGKTLVWFPK